MTAIPNAPLRTGIPGLDRFLTDLVAYLRRPVAPPPLPTVLFADIGSVKVQRTGQMFQVPDHPDGWRLAISDGADIRYVVLE